MTVKEHAHTFCSALIEDVLIREISWCFALVKTCIHSPLHFPY